MAKPRRQKFINYIKEAFFWPVHLVGAAAIAGLTVAAMAVLPGSMGVDAGALLMAGGGVELMYLSFIANNPRFVRAINAKYQKDIDAFYQTKTIAEYYNELGIEAQHRYDNMRKRIREVKDNYTRLNARTPEVVYGFLNKLNTIEGAYARLLYYMEKLNQPSNEEFITKTVSEIDKLNQELKTATGRLRELKEKRLGLLSKRMDNVHKLGEKRQVIEEQLQTFEELVEYIKEQPISLQNTDKEDTMIDNLLFETEQTQETLAEIESLLDSEFSPAFSGNIEGGLENDGGQRLKE